MKIRDILRIGDLSMRDLLTDQHIFALNCRWQDKPFDYKVYNPECPPDIPKELRCSCRPTCTMTAKTLRDIYEHPDKYVLIRIEE